jgi:hypothetical protein
MKLGKITQEEAMQAVLEYKSAEMLQLIKEAITLKRKKEENDKNQMELPLDKKGNK